MVGSIPPGSLGGFEQPFGARFAPFLPPKKWSRVLHYPAFKVNPTRLSFGAPLICKAYEADQLERPVLADSPTSQRTARDPEETLAKSPDRLSTIQNALEKGARLTEMLWGAKLAC